MRSSREGGEGAQAGRCGRRYGLLSRPRLATGAASELRAVRQSGERRTMNSWLSRFAT